MEVPHTLYEKARYIILLEYRCRSGLKWAHIISAHTYIKNSKDFTEKEKSELLNLLAGSADYCTDERPEDFKFD